MSKNWLLLLMVIGAVCVWFVGKTSMDLWTYQRLTKAVPAQLERWEIVEKGGKHYIAAEYLYEYQEKQYSGKTVFKSPTYLNALSAEKDLKHWQEWSWNAWIDPQNAAHSSLQKMFPTKSVLSALVVSAIFAYFVWLSRRRVQEVA